VAKAKAAFAALGIEPHDMPKLKEMLEAETPKRARG
jgi:hypothetical protein